MEYEIKDGKLIIDIESLIQEDLEEQGVKRIESNQIEDKEYKSEREERNFGFADEKVKSRIKVFNNENSEKDFGFENHDTNERFNTGQLLITMSTEKQEDFGQISDIDNDIYGYDRIRIFEIMGRKSDKVCLINDGPDIMYALLNHSGVDDDTGIWTHQTEEELEKNWSTQDNLKATWSVNEVMVYPGEKAIFTDVYEIRVRSPTQGNRYRVTEYDIIGNTIRQVM